jgi:hypothetical protein
LKLDIRKDNLSEIPSMIPNMASPAPIEIAGKNPVSHLTACIVHERRQTEGVNISALFSQFGLSGHPMAPI